MPLRCAGTKLEQRTWDNRVGDPVPIPCPLPDAKPPRLAPGQLAGAPCKRCIFTGEQLPPKPVLGLRCLGLSRDYLCDYVCENLPTGKLLPDISFAEAAWFRAQLGAENRLLQNAEPAALFALEDCLPRIWQFAGDRDLVQLVRVSAGVALSASEEFARWQPLQYVRWWRNCRYTTRVLAPDSDSE